MSRLREPNKRVKRLKMRDLDSLLLSEQGRVSSEITMVTAIKLSDEPSPIPMDNTSVEAAETAQSSGFGKILQSTILETEKNKEITSPCLPTKSRSGIEPDAYISDPAAVVVDLNNPFYPYKKLGEVKSTTTSECGSTTGPVENNESMRRWKEMKENGFLTSFRGTAIIPKPRGRPPKRKKCEDGMKKNETLKRDQVNRYLNVAAPTGLLSGLNPGIIKHVRNSKQVNSIIEAMLQSEKLEQQELLSGRKETPTIIASDVDLCRKRAFDLASNGQREQVGEPNVPEHNFNHVAYNRVEANSGLNEEDDDGLALKLSSGLSKASEHASSATELDVLRNPDDINSLSFKAASVASQWLELIQLDIKGRLAALRRSKKRVKNAIQIELPYLLSEDLAPDQENRSLSAHSSVPGSLKKATLDSHMVQWKALFSQMERSLLEEGKHLGRWLRQVEDLQLQCEKGLKYVAAIGVSNMNRIDGACIIKLKISLRAIL
ncbi:hypothetical protein AXF42_Ash004474 [Apostasia shenzhenica]|uniref:Uncharacterized protein n=1 Tax=Apostasia shenzhenica TaxID=1088818 RepID=A0A2I0BGU0_9ASPA|nr:hypothetical protein AXF42_Ash004474 [Apostasia shenzhenica]